MQLTAEYLDQLRAGLPELPDEKRRRYAAAGLSMQDVLVLANNSDVAAYFERVLAAGADIKAAANWMMGDITGYCKVRFSGWGLVHRGLSNFLGFEEDKLRGS